jgi:biotin carboxyl carrier protein
MEFKYQLGGEIVSVRVEKSGGGYVVAVGDQTFVVEASLTRPGELSFTLNGARLSAFVAADGPRRWVALDSQPFVLTIPQPGRRSRRERHAAHDTLEAPMPGTVRRLLAGAGDQVEKGQVLVLMEAMKMEIKVSAPHAGVIEKILVSEGQAVERGQVLVDLTGP